MVKTSHSSQKVPRVCVVQIGARRNYAIPIALQQAGMLECLFTDWYSPKSFVSRAVAATGKVLRARIIDRAKARVTNEIPVDRVVHFPGFALEYKWRKFVAARKREKAFAYIWGGQRFCTRVLHYGLPQCDAVFCFSSVAKELFSALSDSSVIRILDQEIPPLAYDDKLVREQEAAYPEWCYARPEEDGVEQYTQRQKEEWALADLILCPSSFCQRALSATGAPIDKIRMLPFGIHQKFFSEPAGRHNKGKFSVLFVANSPIRKGLPDLVLALERLRSHEIKGTVVGNLSGVSREGIDRASKCAELLGCVPATNMANLYRQVHVLVHPTVSDTFGAVVLEAMAAGLPVITTPHCGAADIIRDGIDGFIVPVRSPDAIAEKLDLLAGNRELLQWMSENARQRAQEYSLDKYRERLVKVIHDALGAREE